MLPGAVHCPGCGKRYVLPEALAPGKKVTVRCPVCGHRFTLKLGAATEDTETALGQEETPPVVPPEPSGQEPEPAEAAEAGEETGSEREHTESERRRRLRRARRLARALVHNVLQGQRARRDRALADDSLLLEFGEEIRRAWETYQVKAGRDMARQTTYFREALNEILADGKQLF